MHPQIDQADVPVLENYDVISSFEPLTELPEAAALTTQSAKSGYVRRDETAAPIRKMVDRGW